jgi:hypothetical protein
VDEVVALAQAGVVDHQREAVVGGEDRGDHAGVGAEDLVGVERVVAARPGHGGVDGGPHLGQVVQAAHGVGVVRAQAVALAGDLVVQGGVGGVGLGARLLAVVDLERDAPRQAQHLDQRLVALVLEGADEAGVSDRRGGQLGLAGDPRGLLGVGRHPDAGGDDEGKQRDRQGTGDLGADRDASNHVDSVLVIGARPRTPTP